MMTFILFFMVTVLIWIAWFIGWMLIDNMIDYFNKVED